MLDGTSEAGTELGTKVVTDGAITMVLLVYKVYMKIGGADDETGAFTKYVVWVWITMVVTCSTGRLDGTLTTPLIAQFDGKVGCWDDGIY
jgi:hypothetical protein